MNETDLPRDAHLRAALRHAPDRALAPPPAVRAVILAAAHAALHDTAPQRAGRWRPRWRALWDLLRQPAAGAAFASLALATVLALMWRGAPTDAAHEAPLARAPAAASPAVVEAAAPQAAAPQAPRERAPSARPPERPPAATAAAVAPDAAGRAAADVSPRDADPLAPALAALAGAPHPAARAAEQANAGSAGDAAPAAWLAELRRETRGRWHATAAAPEDPGTALLGHDGRLLGRLHLDETGAWWQDADGRWWRAPLAATALQRLRVPPPDAAAPR